MIVPLNLMEKTLKDLHEAHPGVSCMKALRRSYVWWPDLDRNIEKLVFSCEMCQMNQAMPQKTPIHHMERTNNP